MKQMRKHIRGLALVKVSSADYNKQFKSGCTLLLVLLIVFLIGSLTGCQNTEGGAAGGIDTSGVEPLSEVTELTGDCVIPDKQMATIAGKDGEYRFTGSTEEGIIYTWIYDGKLIQNPQEQHLKVTVDNAGLEEVKKAANNATAGLGIILEPMVMAAPADLELILTEKWEADAVVYCQYQDGQVQRISDARISKQGKGKKAVTVLTFAVPRAGGTYYLVGGSSKATPESAGTDRAAGEDTVSTDGDTGETVSGDLEDPAETAGNGGSGGSSNGGSDKGSGSSSSGSSGNGESSAAAPAETSAPLTCTISIECSAVLNNWEDLDQSKAEFVPADGWILKPVQVEFTEGETVFDVLKRVCKEADIHMASRYTPIYGSYYIEGINQLYEFDCGGQSGWNYIVNDWHPNYGCSSYEVSDGDVIEWRYTCDLGSDVGGGWN